MLSSHNKIVKYVAKRSLLDYTCTLGCNVSWLSSRFNLKVNTSSILCNVYTAINNLRARHMSEDLSATCDILHELCDTADGQSESVLSCSEARELAAVISTM